MSFSRSFFNASSLLAIAHGIFGACQVTAAMGTLTITAKPKGQVRVELTDPYGNKSASGGSYENKQAKSGQWKLVARASGYEDREQMVYVRSDAVTPVKIDLKPLGGLRIDGTLAGAAVRASGPGGLHDDGGRPAEADGLRSGTYQVKVTRAGYGERDETVRVESGAMASVPVASQKGASISSDLVGISGGTFWMGSAEESDEKPVTRVTLSPYWMDRTEVTVAAYTACVRAGNCTEPTSGGDCNWGVHGKDSHPINCVDWNQAKAFCEAQGKRLPTEAEWEFGARGKDSWKYPWGDAIPNAPLAKWKSPDGTDPVGSHPGGASPFGLQDMAGNAWEWVEDAYAQYPGGSVTNPRQELGQSRVLRGGGWYDYHPAVLRGAGRGSSDPGTRSNDLGFRCASAGPS